MVPRTCLVALLLASVQAFTFQRNIRHIPVEVRYEHPSENALKNLEERLQLSADELRNQENHGVLAKANLGEKLQLSQEDLSEAYKHLPQATEEETLQKLGEKSVLPPNRLTLLEDAQKFITKGFKDLRENFKPQAGDSLPDPALWERLDKDIKEYFERERNNLELKQDQGVGQTSFFQTIANGIQSVTNNVIQGFQGQGGAANATNQGDEQQPGGVAGFIGYFQGGVQNILNQFSQNQLPPAGVNSTVLGDTGTQNPPQGPGGFITGIFSGVQQIFQGGSGAQPGSQANGTQGDTGTSQPGGPSGFFAGAINQFNQVVGTFTGQQSTEKPANAQGDEGTNSSASAGSGGPQNPIQVIQSIGNNLGNAFTQLVQGAQQGNRPQGSEDENSGDNQGQNFLQQISSNLGNAFQNIQNNFRPSTAKPAVEGADGGSGGSVDSSNPIGQISGAVQNVGNQIQQAIGQQPGANPIESIQAAIPGSGGASGSSEKNPSKEKPNEKPADESQKNNDEEKPVKPVEDIPAEAAAISEKLEEKKEQPATETESGKKEEIMMAQE